jgi:hypothetical protein
MSASAVESSVALSVPKTTGTQGDALIAWGLSIFLSELLGDGEPVFLSDVGESFRLEADVSYIDLDQAITAFTKPGARSRLKWLESQQNGRLAPESFKPREKLDRDATRDAYTIERANANARKSQTVGGEPALALGDTKLYPFYEVLTNPGTQWTGYNSFVEELYATLTPDGVRALLTPFDTSALLPALDTSHNPAKRGAKQRTFNPPGFLYPGMNKGPTMRIVDPLIGTIGSASAIDWTLVDRGDRTVFENYLAYIGYFQVARIVTTKEQRIVVVPIPVHVKIPDVLGVMDEMTRRGGLQREMEKSDLTEYLAAKNALEYGQVALLYLDSLQANTAAANLRENSQAFSGIYLSVFWRPNGNVYAPRRLTRVSLPTWLSVLARQSREGAKATLEQHHKRLKSVRGRWRDENKLPQEQRQAITCYLLSLNGDLLAWFDAVAAWFPAARAAARINWNVGLWSTAEVRRIALAMSKDSQEQDHASLQALLDAPEFKHLASTIRLSTVVPHIARERRRKDPTAESSPWEIRYELVTRLKQAADRGPKEFFNEFCVFIAEYNDETARPKTGKGRPFARTDDLEWLSAQLTNPKFGKILPAALLAFGTSLRGKGKDAAAGDTDTSDEVADPEGEQGSEGEE